MLNARTAKKVSAIKEHAGSLAHSSSTIVVGAAAANRHLQHIADLFGF